MAVEVIETRLIPQNKMTAECWMIQFRGSKACETCELKGKRDCGGKRIRRTGKNELGYSVPLGNRVE